MRCIGNGDKWFAASYKRWCNHSKVNQCGQPCCEGSLWFGPYSGPGSWWWNNEVSRKVFVIWKCCGVCRRVAAWGGEADRFEDPPYGDFGWLAFGSNCGSRSTGGVCSGPFCVIAECVWWSGERGSVLRGFAEHCSHDIVVEACESWQRPLR